MLDPRYPSVPPVKTTGAGGDASASPSSTDEQNSSFTLTEEKLKEHFALQLNEELVKLCLIGNEKIDEYPRNAMGIDALVQLMRFIRDLLEQEDIETLIIDQAIMRSSSIRQTDPHRTFKIMTKPYSGWLRSSFQRAEKVQELFYRIQRQLLTICDLDCSFIRNHLKISIYSTDLLNATRECSRTEFRIEFL